MADATRVREWNDIRMVAQAAVPSGKIWQTRDGRAAYSTGLNSAAIGDQVGFQSQGQVTLPFKAGIQALDGGPAYWDRTNSVVTYQRLGANRGFALGSFVGDTALNAANCVVNLNVFPKYDLDLEALPFATSIIKTAGVPLLNTRGGAIDMVLDTTNEAQKVDALSNDGIITGSKGIVEIGANILNNGTANNLQGFLGLASATHATNPASVTEYILFEFDGNALKINAQSSDGTTTVAKTDTTKVFVVGTRFELWIDMRNPANCGMYVNGVQVLAGTVFSLAAGASNLFLLAWLGKTANATSGEMQVDWMRVRTAEQSVNGV